MENDEGRPTSTSADLIFDGSARRKIGRVAYGVTGLGAGRDGAGDGMAVLALGQVEGPCAGKSPERMGPIGALFQILLLVS